MQSKYTAQSWSIEGRTFVSLFLLRSENFLPLSEHVQVHGREERDVEQHGDQYEQGEAEGGVELVRQVEAQHVLLVGVEETGVLTEELP